MNIPLQLPEASTIKQIVTCTIEGSLEPEDLLALVNGKAAPAAGVEHDQVAAPRAPEVDDPTDLKRIREKHHNVARLLASGMTQRLVASVTGYTESYLSILLNNPAMQELIEHYRILAGNAAQVIGEKLRTVGLTALEKLSDRMANPGDSPMDDQALLGVAKLGLDRSVHGPSSTAKVLQETHVIDHAELARLNREAQLGSREYIVPVSEVRQAALPARKEGDE